ncbi:hypothetical protein D3C71_1039260 [compost metagenome]
MIAFLLGRQDHLAATGLARGFAFFRRLDTVVDRVAHQVDQRVGQGLDEVLVEVGFFADQFQVDLFLELASQVANQAREAPEDFLDRLHPGLHDRGLQVGRDHVEVRHGLGHGFVAAVEAQADQAVTHQHQLADHVHDLVETRGIDAHGGLGFARRLFRRWRGRGTGRCRCSSCRGRRFGFWLGGPGHRFRRGCLGGRCRNRGVGAGCRSNRRAHFSELAFAVQFVEQRFELVIGNQIAAGRHRAGCRGRGHRSNGRLQRLDSKVTLAVQLVEQCFEFVVSNIGTVASRFRGFWRSRCRDHRVNGELAFTVQLIEQRLELGIGDFVAASGIAGRRWNSRRGLGLGLDGVQRVQQLFEFIVGDIARLAFSHRRLDHGDDRCGSRLVSRLRLGQTGQCREQFRCRGRDRAAFADFAEHAVHRVQRFENHVHQFRVDATFTLAQDVEHVLGDVAALHQLVELEEAGAPFYSVKTAKNCIEQIRIIRTAFQLDQLLGQLL